MQAYQYSWVEAYSPAHDLVYFFNQETKESTWDRPADLAWRRVLVQDSA